MRTVKNKLALAVLSATLLAGSCMDTSHHLEVDILADMGGWTSSSPSIDGKPDYLDSPFVAAGDRLYMVGHQNGTFPELGWHIKGEMGGIWNHPIKLMDGLELRLQDGPYSNDLTDASLFTNFPYANRHRYNWEEAGLRIDRWNFVPDGKQGMYVQLIIENQRDARSVQLSVTGHSDLRPTWLGERSNMIDAADTLSYLQAEDAWMMNDSSNPWFVLFGADLPSDSHQAAESDYAGQGASGTLSYNIALPAHGKASITLKIAGSYSSKEDALQTYAGLNGQMQALVEAKKARYEDLARRSKLTIPDKDLEETFEWLKYNCDWLIRIVPEVGSGITAGIPDYPWWFGVDSEYALQGYTMIGQNEAVNNTIALLDAFSEAENGNGRIIHEMSTNGVVFNPGNINETPQFASLIWKVYQWNGDKTFLEKYFPTIENGLEWLMATKDADNNLFPDGFGMMEIHGLDSEMIDVAAYTQKAFADASKMASVLGKEDLATAYSEKAQALKTAINERFWSEEFSSYADFIGTDKQALHLIDDAIVRADTLNKPWAVEELKATRDQIKANPSTEARPFVLHHNWVVNTPMEMGIADPDKAIKALTTAEQFVNPFGVFVTGIDRDESASSDDGSFAGSKVFSYTGAVMTLPTGVQAVAENNYGRPDKALNYLQRMTRSFSYALPGSMYEVSPDYGMMAQAWNIYSFAVPIVEQFFGIRPDAADQKIQIRINMPSAWDQAKLEKVHIADNVLTIEYRSVNGYPQLDIDQTQNWEIEVLFDRETGNGIGTSRGTTVNLNEAGDHQILSTENRIEIKVFE